MGYPFILGMLGVLGCAAREVHWRDEAGVIDPERVATRGYLSVEEIDPLVFTSRAPRFRSAPFLLYDPQGRYLTKFDDPYLPPIALHPGRYIVVAAVRGEEHQIQVLVKEARLTRVDLSRLDPGRVTPEVSTDPVPDPRP